MRAPRGVEPLYSGSGFSTLENAASIDPENADDDSNHANINERAYSRMPYAPTYADGRTEDPSNVCLQ
jgi:hypothetical protein